MLSMHLNKSVQRRIAISTRCSSSAAKFPHLPVPELRKTLDRYLQSLKPFLLEEEVRGGPSFDSAYASKVTLANKFESGIGKICQERLQELDRKSPHNWLEDNFWLKKAYHEWRAPLLINSNWWLAFHNDKSIPEEAISNPGRTGLTPWQIRRAAWLVHRCLEFKDKLEDSQEFHSETTRTGVWVRENTARIFNVCRIPQINCDALSIRPPSSDANARKILVNVHDWCYSVTVYGSHGKSLKVWEIERQLRAISQDVKQRLDSGERATPVGVLSSDDRDIWAQNLHHLISLSPKNSTTYNTILQSVFALSLDLYTHTLPSSSSPPTDSQPELDAHLHNIRSGINAHNRWFDKSFTLIVESNTRAGAMGEHSPVDALVPSIVGEYAVVQGIEPSHFPIGVNEDYVEDAPQEVGWERLDWVVDDVIKKGCVEAEKRASVIIQDSDDSVLWFKSYGSDWMKTVAQLSPDAYVQMALQLAWYITRTEFAATYETALTRMFKHGRTETIRTLTADSRAFVLTMNDPQSSTSLRFALLQRAVATHVSLTREAATGRGIDRHLLGLQLMLNGENSEFFDDPHFKISQRWTLSTSGLSAGHQFRGTGFGAAYPDGYGINYLSGPDMIKFGIESKSSSPLTSTHLFKYALVKALHDMQEICLLHSKVPSHL